MTTRTVTVSYRASAYEYVPISETDEWVVYEKHIRLEDVRPGRVQRGTAGTDSAADIAQEAAHASTLTRMKLAMVPPPTREVYIDTSNPCEYRLMKINVNTVRHASILVR